jgi:hypothetical protein
MVSSDICPKCGGVEIRLMYKRSSDGRDEWDGSCWDCQHKWTVNRDDPEILPGNADLTV